MNRTAGRIFALAALLLAGSMTGAGLCADVRISDPFAWRIERDIRRFKFAGTPDVMDLLAVRPGMTILDIGTGTGQFAYEFSRRLNGTGMVHATDTQARCVAHVGREAERRGLGNIHPVLVDKEGLDAFYGKHRYDLIAIFHVAMAYGDKVDYLRGLRGSLAEGGRLALILPKIPTLFSPGDFTGDFRVLIGELSREPADSPFFGILKDSTRELIRENPGTYPPERIGKAVVDDINEAMQSGGRFFRNFLDGADFRRDVGFSPGERAFADFLLLSFNRWKPDDGDPIDLDSGTPVAGNRSLKPPTRTGTRDKADGLFLNKLLFMQKYRGFLRPDRLFASGMTPPARAAFEEAGYVLRHEYPDVIPFEDIVIFSAR